LIAARLEGIFKQLFRRSEIFQPRRNNALNHMLSITFKFERIRFCHPIGDLPGLRPTAGSYLFRENIDKNIEITGRFMPAGGVSIGSCEKGRQIDPDIRQRPLQSRFEEFVVLPLNKIGKGTLGVVQVLRYGFRRRALRNSRSPSTALPRKALLAERLSKGSTASTKLANSAACYRPGSRLPCHCSAG